MVPLGRIRGLFDATRIRGIFRRSNDRPNHGVGRELPLPSLHVGGHRRRMVGRVAYGAATQSAADADDTELFPPPGPGTGRLVILGTCFRLPDGRNWPQHMYSP